MNWDSVLQSAGTAVLIALIFGIAKLFWDVQEIKTKAEPLFEWWRKTSIDALKIATNPTSERLTELANKYIASVNGKQVISVAEKQELIDGLREIMNDVSQYPAKRQSASMSLRFIETREGLTA